MTDDAPAPAIDPGALAGITPEQFVELMNSASDDDIVAAIHAVGTDAVLTRVFQGFEERFLADKAATTAAVMQFAVTDEGQTHHHVVAIEGGTCTVSSGQADDPRVTLTLDLLPFLKLVSGKANGPALFMGGKLKIAGDLMFAPKIMSYFDAPG